VHAALTHWWDAPDGPVVVRTSGSTAAPKDVMISRPALAASAEATQTRLGGPGQWLLDLPATFVAGLQVLVRSLVAETTPVVAAEHGSFAAAVAALGGGRCYTALVPTQLHRLAVAGELELLRRFEAVLVGGAAVRPDLLNLCTDAQVPVVRTYGLTETCGGCVYDGYPLDGIEVRIGATGRIELAGPVLFDGYAGDPALTAQTLRDGWLLTGDLGTLAGDGRLAVLGRVDDVVISGGVNVSLPAVTATLLGLPEVVDAVAVGIDDSEWGLRVVACVVVPPGRPVPSLATVRRACAQTLPRTWAPRDVVRLEELPLRPGGKVDRAALAALTAARIAGRGGGA